MGYVYYVDVSTSEEQQTNQTSSTILAKSRTPRYLTLLCIVFAIVAIVLAIVATYYYSKSVNLPPSQIVYQDSPSSEVVALRAQTDEIARSQDALISATVGSLGIAATVVVAALALGTLAFRIQFDREVQVFREAVAEESRDRRERDQALWSFSRETRQEMLASNSQQDASIQSLQRIQLSSMSLIQMNRFARMLDDTDAMIRGGRVEDGINELARILEMLESSFPDLANDQLVIARAGLILQTAGSVVGLPRRPLETLRDGFSFDSDRWSQVGLILGNFQITLDEEIARATTRDSAPP